LASFDHFVGFSFLRLKRTATVDCVVRAAWPVFIRVAFFQNILERHNTGVLFESILCGG